MPDTLDTVNPSYIYQEERAMGRQASAPASAFLTRQAAQVAPRTWRLVYGVLTAAERATLEGVFTAAQTGDGTTTFTPRGAGSPVTVWFPQGTPQGIYHTPTDRELSVVVEEAL